MLVHEKGTINCGLCYACRCLVCKEQDKLSSLRGEAPSVLLQLKLILFYKDKSLKDKLTDMKNGK